jgi:tRNA (adenine-N(1)-)-methyltransferase non-catalytic subunit
MCVDNITGLVSSLLVSRIGLQGTGFVVHCVAAETGPRHFQQITHLGLDSVAEHCLKCVSFATLAKCNNTDSSSDHHQVASSNEHVTDDQLRSTQMEMSSTANVLGDTKSCNSVGESELEQMPPLTTKNTKSSTTRRYSHILTQTETTNVLKDGVDSLVMATAVHPCMVLARLWRFLNPSGSFVVYSQYIEPLGNLCSRLRDGRHAVQLILCDSFFREYQVLPSRTHPLITMSCTGGYLLSGIKVESDGPKLTGREVLKQQQQSCHEAGTIKRSPSDVQQKPVCKKTKWSEH